MSTQLITRIGTAILLLICAWRIYRILSKARNQPPQQQSAAGCNPHVFTPTSLKLFLSTETN